VTIEKRSVVEGDLLEEAWKLYSLSFDELRYLALQRHVMYAEEFDAVMADPLVEKHLIFDDGDRSLQGLATITTHLRSMPLISPDYFARRWPERYLASEIYYIGFVGVHPHSHGTGLFGELIQSLGEDIARVGGVGVVDVCNHNKDRLHLPRAIRWLLSTWADVEMTELDAQTYVGYEFKRAG
jgi:hypothetical protein